MKTVEEIVKEKEYFELSDEELTLVSELAQNQDEYDQLKHFLTESASFYDQNRVRASQGMRDHIVEKLYPPTTNESIAWYQSLGTFFFPPRKPFYKYPAFQMASILIVFLIVFSYWENPFEEKKLAQNTVKNQQKIIKEQDINGVNDKVLIDTSVLKESNGDLMTSDVSSNPNLLETQDNDLEELEVDDDLGNLSTKVDEYIAEDEHITIEEELTIDRHVTATAAESEPLTAPSSNLNLDIKDNYSSSEKIITASPERELSTVEVAKVNSLGKKKFKRKKEEKSKALLFENESMDKEVAGKIFSIAEIKGISELFFEVK